jgi:hypothetical protein
MLLNQVSRRLPHWVVPVLGSLLMMPILPTTLHSSVSMQQAQLRPSLEDPTSNSNRTVAALALAALGVGVVAWSWKAQPHASASKSVLMKPSLQHKLLTLLHNDRQAANRLIQQTQVRHPDRSLDWCVEKVIYDLQRDRH